MMTTTYDKNVGITKKILNVLAHSFMSVLDQTNKNITTSQKELLLWHQRLGHLNLQWCQTLFRIPRNENQRQILQPKSRWVATCEHPQCASCLLAKPTKQSPPQFISRIAPLMKLKENDFQPGDKVSIDKYVSSLPGRLLHTRGKEQSHQKLHGGTLFVDHATQYIFIKH